MTKVDMSNKYIVFYVHRGRTDGSEIVAVFEDCTLEEVIQYCKECLIQYVHDENIWRTREGLPVINPSKIKTDKHSAVVRDEGYICFYFQKGIEE